MASPLVRPYAVWLLLGTLAVGGIWSCSEYRNRENRASVRRTAISCISRFINSAPAPVWQNTWDDAETKCGPEISAHIAAECVPYTGECATGTRLALQGQARERIERAAGQRAEENRKEARRAEVEAAVAGLEAKGITRDELKELFRDEIEEELRDKQTPYYPADD